MPGRTLMATSAWPKKVVDLGTQPYYLFLKKNLLLTDVKLNVQVQDKLQEKTCNFVLK